MITVFLYLVFTEMHSEADNCNQIKIYVKNTKAKNKNRFGFETLFLEQKERATLPWTWVISHYNVATAKVTETVLAIQNATKHIFMI